MANTFVYLFIILALCELSRVVYREYKGLKLTGLDFIRLTIAVLLVSTSISSAEIKDLKERVTILESRQVK